MPQWSFMLTGSDVELGRSIVLAARVDPNVLEVNIEEDTPTFLRFTLDTGDEPEPLARNVWNFIQSHSDEWVMNHGRNPHADRVDAAMYAARAAAGGPRLTNPPLTALQEATARIVENYVRESAELMENHRNRLVDAMQSMAMPLIRRPFVNPSALIPIQPLPTPPYLLDEIPTETVGMMTIPVWVEKGIWVEERKHRTAAQIVTVDTELFNVSIKLWKSEPALFLSMNMGQFVEEWGPAEKAPQEGRPWYERLDEDE